jgi:hypothetical protein
MFPTCFLGNAVEEDSPNRGAASRARLFFANPNLASWHLAAASHPTISLPRLDHKEPPFKGPSADMHRPKPSLGLKHPPDHDLGFHKHNALLSGLGVRPPPSTTALQGSGTPLSPSAFNFAIAAELSGRATHPFTTRLTSLHFTLSPGGSNQPILHTFFSTKYRALSLPPSLSPSCYHRRHPIASIMSAPCRKHC